MHRKVTKFKEHIVCSENISMCKEKYIICIPVAPVDGIAYTAVVAERSRRLTWNQIPSESAGSNPASCDLF
jgi:hypothetical protein